MRKRLLLCRNLCRVRDVGGLIENMKRGWKLFVGSVRTSGFHIVIGISVGLLVSAVIAQVNSLENLKELNEYRADIVELRTELVEIGDTWAQAMGNAAELRSEAIELREKVMNLEGTEEEINAAKARIQEIEIGLEKVEANRSWIEALRIVCEVGVLQLEGEITRLEQAVDYDWRMSSLLLSIGVLMFSSGLALWIYKISRKRA